MFGEYYVRLKNNQCNLNEYLEPLLPKHLQNYQQTNEVELYLDLKILVHKMINLLLSYHSL